MNQNSSQISNLIERLSQFTWLAELRTRLQTQYQHNQLPHAILLTSPSGQGKTIFANYFASILLCENKTACGECKSCRIEAAAHPDLQVIAPVSKSKMILIEQVRQLIEYMTLAPHTAPVKVAVIADIDRMNQSSANALLKLLEEPPENRILLMTTSHLGNLLPTIRSRASVYQLPSPTEDQAKDFLSAYLQSEIETAQVSADQESRINALSKNKSAKSSTSTVVNSVKTATENAKVFEIHRNQAFRRYPQAPMSAYYYGLQNGAEVEKLILRWFYQQIVEESVANFPSLPSLEKSTADKITIQQQTIAYTQTVLQALIDMASKKRPTNQHKYIQGILSAVPLSTLIKLSRDIDKIGARLGQTTAVNAIAAITHSHLLTIST